MAVDKNKIINELSSVVNQLQKADCGCLSNVFNSQPHGRCPHHTCHHMSMGDANMGYGNMMGGMGTPGMNMGNPGMSMGNPGMGNPGMGNPGMGNPGMGNPGMGNPGMGNPGMGNSGMGNPGMGNPGMGNPGMGMDIPGVVNSMQGMNGPEIIKGQSGMGVCNPGMGMGMVCPAMKMGDQSFYMADNNQSSMGAGNQGMNTSNAGMDMGNAGMNMGNAGINLGNAGMNMNYTGMNIGNTGMNMGNDGMSMGNTGMHMGNPGIGMGNPSLSMGSIGMGMGNLGMHASNPGMKNVNPGMNMASSGVNAGNKGMTMGLPMGVNPKMMFQNTYNYLSENLMKPTMQELQKDFQDMNSTNTIVNSPESMPPGMRVPEGVKLPGMSGNMTPQTEMTSSNPMQYSQPGMHSGESEMMTVNRMQYAPPEIGSNNPMQTAQPGMIAGNITGQPGMMSNNPMQSGQEMMNNVMGQRIVDMMNTRSKRPMTFASPTATAQESTPGIQNTPMVDNSHMMQTQGHAEMNAMPSNMQMGQMAPGKSSVQNHMPQGDVSQYQVTPVNPTSGFQKHRNDGGNVIPTPGGHLNPGNLPLEALKSRGLLGTSSMIPDSRGQGNKGMHRMVPPEFAKMFPGVLNGEVDFDPMEVAFKMNPANSQAAAMDSIQKMMTNDPVSNVMRKTMGMAPTSQTSKSQEGGQMPANAAPALQTSTGGQSPYGQAPPGNTSSAPFGKQAASGELISQTQPLHPGHQTQPVQYIQSGQQLPLAQQTQPGHLQPGQYPQSGQQQASQQPLLNRVHPGQQLPARQIIQQDPNAPQAMQATPNEAEMVQKTQGRMYLPQEYLLPAEPKRIDYNPLGQPIIYESPYKYKYAQMKADDGGPRPLWSEMPNQYSNVKPTLSKTSLVNRPSRMFTPSKARLRVQNTMLNQYQAVTPGGEMPIPVPDGRPYYNYQSPQMMQVVEQVGDTQLNAVEDKPIEHGQPVNSRGDITKEPVKFSKKNGLQDTVYTRAPCSSWSMGSRLSSPICR